MPPGFYLAIRCAFEGAFGAPSPRFFGPQGLAPGGFLPTGTFGFLAGFCGLGKEGLFESYKGAGAFFSSI